MAWKILLVISLANYVLGENGAISEQRVVIHQLKSEHNAKQSPIGAKKSENRGEEEYALSYPSYEFSYKVEDLETHDIKGQHEKREGDEVKGLYWLIEPNGHKRTVNYQANDNSGFNAQVDYSAKKQYIEYGNKEVKNNYEVIEIIDEKDETNVNKNENKNDEGEQAVSNDQQNNDSTTAVNADESLNESKSNSGDNVEAQENVSNDNDNDREISDHSENQNNDNDLSENENENSEKDAQSSAKVSKRSRGEYKPRNEKYNNRSKNRVAENQNKNVENLRKRSNQNSNKSRHHDSTSQQNRKVNVKNKNRNNEQGNQREGSSSSDIKRKEDIANKNLKPNKNTDVDRHDSSIISNHNNEETNNKFELITNKGKNEIYEHSIRIYHPKPITTKTDRGFANIN